MSSPQAHGETALALENDLPQMFYARDEVDQFKDYDIKRLDEALVEIVSSYHEATKAGQDIGTVSLLRQANMMEALFRKVVGEMGQEARQKQAIMREKLQKEDRGSLKAKVLEAQIRRVDAQINDTSLLEKHKKPLGNMRTAIIASVSSRMITSLAKRMTFFDGPVVNGHACVIRSVEHLNTEQYLNHQVHKLAVITHEFHLDLILFRDNTATQLVTELDSALYWFWQEAQFPYKSRPKQLFTYAERLFAAAETYRVQIKEQNRKQDEHFNTLRKMCSHSPELLEMIKQHKIDLGSKKLRISLAEFDDERLPHGGPAIPEGQENYSRNMVDLRLCSLTGHEWDKDVAEARYRFNELRRTMFYDYRLPEKPVSAKVASDAEASELNAASERARAAIVQAREAKMIEEVQALQEENRKEEERQKAVRKANYWQEECDFLRFPELRHERSSPADETPFGPNYRPLERRENMWFDPWCCESGGESDDE